MRRARVDTRIKTSATPTVDVTVIGIDISIDMMSIAAAEVSAILGVIIEGPLTATSVSSAAHAAITRAVRVSWQVHW
jgi:hypothetical protein